MFMLTYGCWFRPNSVRCLVRQSCYCLCSRSHDQIDVPANDVSPFDGEKMIPDPGQLLIAVPAHKCRPTEELVIAVVGEKFFHKAAGLINREGAGMIAVCCDFPHVNPTSIHWRQDYSDSRVPYFLMAMFTNFRTANNATSDIAP